MNSTAHPWLSNYPDEVDWYAKLTPKSLYALLDEAEQKWPSARAIDFLGKHYTYREVADQTRRMAAALQKMGVKRGVKVGICLPNCPQFVIAYYAILKAGGTVVNFSPLYTAAEIGHQINDSGTEIMFTLALQATYPRVAENLGKTKLKRIIVSSLTEALPLAKRLAFPLLKRSEIVDPPKDENHLSWAALMKPPPQTSAALIHPEADVAVLQYTGGTTGVPKGVVLTHANLTVNAQQCGLWFAGAQEGAERVMGVLPLFHVFAMATVMNFSILKGAEMILHPRFDLKTVLSDIDGKKPTLMPGVPTLFAAISQCKELQRYDLTSLKYCISGGGPLAQEVQRKFEELTGCKLVEGYGLSEASPVTCCNPLSGRNKIGTIGLPFPGTVMEVVDLEDREKALGPHEIGEICIRGPQVMHGYWQQLLETENVLKNGRLHTGDIGYYDEEGYSAVVDRLKEMIISGGFNIYPRHIEEACYRHSAVAECAAIGVPHEKRGEVPKLFVVLAADKPATVEDIAAFLKEELHSYAVPRDIVIRDALPKTPVGKIDKKALKKL